MQARVSLIGRTVGRVEDSSVYFWSPGPHAELKTREDQTQTVTQHTYVLYVVVIWSTKTSYINDNRIKNEPNGFAVDFVLYDPFDICSFAWRNPFHTRSHATLETYSQVQGNFHRGRADDCFAFTKRQMSEACWLATECHYIECQRRGDVRWWSA